MKYFIDTEFIEGKQNKSFLGFNYSKTKPTIDLISIGIVSEDNSKYYAISKDFNLKEAWNRVQVTSGVNEKPYYWIRENVLFSIWKELSSIEYLESNNSKINIGKGMTYKSLEKLINKYGKTNNEIAEEIKEFVGNDKPVFYGYYSAYDWVVFCQIYGIMMNLPKGFPYYCIDLKQTADDIWVKTGKETRFSKSKNEHNALNDAQWNKDFYNFLINL